ncbi:hypothetical protein ACFFHJ_08875 [Planotetraspora thailandica]|uniref:hypothetical protein n=1 Tax=Planotetraspora thailandica TaxID=487172 RepID=UPI00195198D5|nr:hypothetical protein [Planotetraspora thailandica]
MTLRKRRSEKPLPSGGGGVTPFFDPLGWDPHIGIDVALGLLGWTCEKAAGGTAAEALARLEAASVTGPVVVGPVEMGLLLHQPGSGKAMDADHWVVVNGVSDGVVRFHDPHGHPFATLPAHDFLAAWNWQSPTYPAEPYVMRWNFTRAGDVDPVTAVRGSLPAAARWLGGPQDDGQASLSEAGASLGGAAAAERLADVTEAGLARWQVDHLVWFAIRVGARRLSDASAWLGTIGLPAAAAIAWEQAELVGGLQHSFVSGDNAAAAASLRRLAPTYERLREEIAAHL